MRIKVLFTIWFTFARNSSASFQHDEKNFLSGVIHSFGRCADSDQESEGHLSTFPQDVCSEASVQEEDGCMTPVKEEESSKGDGIVAKVEADAFDLKEEGSTILVAPGVQHLAVPIAHLPLKSRTPATNETSLKEIFDGLVTARKCSTTIKLAFRRVRVLERHLTEDDLIRVGSCSLAPFKQSKTSIHKLLTSYGMVISDKVLQSLPSSFNRRLLKGQITIVADVLDGTMRYVNPGRISKRVRIVECILDAVDLSTINRFIGRALRSLPLKPSLIVHILTEDRVQVTNFHDDMNDVISRLPWHHRKPLKPHKKHVSKIYQSKSALNMFTTLGQVFDDSVAVFNPDPELEVAIRRARALERMISESELHKIRACTIQSLIGMSINLEAFLIQYKIENVEETQIALESKYFTQNSFTQFPYYFADVMDHVARSTVNAGARPISIIREIISKADPISIKVLKPLTVDSFTVTPQKIVELLELCRVKPGLKQTRWNSLMFSPKTRTQRSKRLKKINRSAQQPEFAWMSQQLPATEFTKLKDIFKNLVRARGLPDDLVRAIRRARALQRLLLKDDTMKLGTCELHELRDETVDVIALLRRYEIVSVKYTKNRHVEFFKSADSMESTVFVSDVVDNTFPSQLRPPQRKGKSAVLRILNHVDWSTVDELIKRSLNGFITINYALQTLTTTATKSNRPNGGEWDESVQEAIFPRFSSKRKLQ